MLPERDSNGVIFSHSISKIEVPVLHPTIAVGWEEIINLTA